VTAMLEVRDLRVSYGKIEAVKGISFSVDTGSVVTLIGGNGAGKTTTLRTLSGLLKAAAGEILFEGTRIDGMPAHEIVKRGIAQSPEGRKIFPRMTVAENLELGAFTRRDRAGVEADLAHVYELFPRLGQRLNQPAGSLSGGEQQQLALAKAILLEPSVLCIDELSLGLAPIVVQELLEIVRRINAAGVAVVLVEQSLNIASQLCTRALFMEKGAIRFEGSPTDLLERDDLARAVFLGGADRGDDQ